MNKITEITNKRDVDECPDTSHLGKYVSTPEAGAIDRKARGDIGRGEYRYFVPANPEYGEDDYQRSESLNRGDWCFMGVYAVATVSRPVPHGFRLESLQSGGLWGIESDSGDEYFMEVARDELEDLRAHLDAFGVDTSDFDIHAAAALEA